MLKESQLKALIKVIVEEIMGTMASGTDLSMTGPGDKMTNANGTQVSKIDPAEEERMKMQQRKSNRAVVQNLQKKEKALKKQIKAKGEMDKMDQKSLENQINQRKREGV